LGWFVQADDASRDRAQEAALAALRVAEDEEVRLGRGVEVCRLEVGLSQADRDPPGAGIAGHAEQHAVRQFGGQLAGHDLPEAARDVERDPSGFEDAEQEGKRRSAGDDEKDKDLI